MQRAHFFGYGSLVNTRTHAYPRAQAATLSGWRREWRLTRLRPEVFLSARPAPGAEIDGLVAEVPGQDWAALDLREGAYGRHDVSQAVTCTAAALTGIQVYAVRPDLTHPEGRGAILLSYLDVVVQGFLHQFGEEGVTRFFDTTDGWDPPVLDDRGAPRYPRHQILSRKEAALVEAHLDRLGIARIGLG